MSKAFEFCIPTKATSVPTGPEWLHEIKYDGYRLRHLTCLVQHTNVTHCANLVHFILCAIRNPRRYPYVIDTS
jgi:hypothetical protein